MRCGLENMNIYEMGGSESLVDGVHRNAMYDGQH